MNVRARFGDSAVPSPTAGDRMVLRSTSSVWIFVVLSAFLAFLVGDAVLRGAVSFALGASPWILLAIWSAYMLLLRPCVVVQPAGLTIVNIVRTHRVPWARVTDLTSRFQLTVHIDNGRRITSWGAPSIGTDRPSVASAYSRRDAHQQSMRASGVRRRNVRAIPSLPTSRLIERARDAWELRELSREGADVAATVATGPAAPQPAEAAHVTTKIAAVPVAIGVILVALCALQVLNPDW